MITEKDLMLGNYLKWKDNGSIFELTIAIFCDKNFQNHLSCGDIEPIILSEEILLKCGFEKHASNPFWFFKNMICISLVGKIELLSLDRQIFKLPEETKYLHELQCPCVSQGRGTKARGTANAPMHQGFQD